MSKQLLRSGTSVGANVREGHYAQSKKDFISKMNIALKEAGETDYWRANGIKCLFLQTKSQDRRNELWHQTRHNT
jgi:four helix bundle protein